MVLLIYIMHVLQLVWGNPYGDGSFKYYISESTRVSDFKGYGPFLYSAIELEKTSVLGK